MRDYYYESTSEQEGLEDAIKKSIEIGMPYHVTKKYSEVSTVFNSGMDTVWAGEVSAEDAQTYSGTGKHDFTVIRQIRQVRGPLLSCLKRGKQT